MKSLKYILQKLPGEPEEILYATLPLTTPPNILIMQHADLTTNSYILRNQQAHYTNYINIIIIILIIIIINLV